jgi:hypothetical protein
MFPGHAETLDEGYRDSSQNSSCGRRSYGTWESGVCRSKYGDGVAFTKLDGNQAVVLQEWLSVVDRVT